MEAAETYTGTRINYTNRYVVTCRSCKAKGIFDPATGETKAEAKTRICPEHGASEYLQKVGFTLKEILGQYSPVKKCGSLCRGARGPACDCSCAGANHGGG